MKMAERMAKLEEKVENIKENLDDVVKHKLPNIEKKIEGLSKYIYIAIGLAMAAQIAIEHFFKNN
jgi:tetrahydromethanopterin S-methyltransferase subunit G